MLSQVRPRRFAYVGNKTKPTANESPDDGLSLSVVVYCSPEGVDSGCQRGIRDDPSVPNCVDELVLADDSIALVDQIRE